MSDSGCRNETMQWFWGSNLGELEKAIKYRYGRGHFLQNEGFDGLGVGNAWPEDITDEEGEATLMFHNLVYHEVPLYEGGGYYVTRLPPRPVMAQLFREESHRSEDVPASSPNPPEKGAEA